MKQNITVLALLGVTHAVSVKKQFAIGIPDSQEHAQSLKMKEKTLQEFNVAQLSSDVKDKFAIGMPDSQEHAQKFRMKEKTLQEFNVV